MWVFTRYGFFSAVQARTRGGLGKPDPTKVTVRARRREHLESLADRFPVQLGKVKILATVSTDYAFRVVLPVADWAFVAGSLAAEAAQYGNFKDECHKQCHDDPGYVAALHSVWDVMHATQDRREDEEDGGVDRLFRTRRPTPKNDTRRYPGLS